MGFFEDSTMEKIAQGNIKKLQNLEEKEAKKMLALFKRVRVELQDRLLTVPGETFTEQQLRVTLTQVEAAIVALREVLKMGISESANVVAQTGVKDLEGEVEKFSKHFEGTKQPINLDAVRIGLDTKNFLINRYESSLEAYSESLRSHLTQGLTESLIARRSYGEVVSELNRFFAGEEWKVHRIARTELHNVYNLAKQKGMEETKEILPDLKKALIHPIDDRTGEDSKLAARLNLVVDVNKPFKYTYKGKVREYMTPPDRPNDRSVLVPYREDWN